MSNTDILRLNKEEITFQYIYENGDFFIINFYRNKINNKLPRQKLYNFLEKLKNDGLNKIFTKNYDLTSQFQPEFKKSFKQIFGSDIETDNVFSHQNIIDITEKIEEIVLTYCLKNLNECACKKTGDGRRSKRRSKRKY